MIKTYDIDLDDELVENATRLFEELGTDIDTAIKIFLKQAVLRRGFPFEVAVPETENGKLKIENCEPIGGGVKSVEAEVAPETENHAESDCDDLHCGISEEEEFAAVTATAESVETSSVSPEIAARVAANEALVAEMRNEIGEKEVTPEFDENEDDGTHGNYEQGEFENEKPKVESSEPIEVGEQACVEESVSVEENSCETENLVSEVENSVEAGNLSESEVAPEKKNPADASAGDDGSDDEDEDETTPDNLFDAWDVGDEEEVGCK